MSNNIKAPPPLVSVITCVYNGESHLEQTIKSVLAQTYPNIEYIVIDGGSTDNTLTILEKYKDDIDVVVSEKDKGIADAMNKGIDLAKGQIVGIIHSDDWYDNNAVALAVSALKSSDIAYGYLMYWKDEVAYMVYKCDHTLLKNEMTVSHPTVFIKKSVYEKYGTYNLNYKLAMDYDKLLMYMIEGCQFQLINKVLANFRYSGASDQNWISAYNEVRIIKNKHIGNSLKNLLYFMFQVIKTSISRLLQYVKLHSIINEYRKHFSHIEKESKN